MKRSPAIASTSVRDRRRLTPRPYQERAAARCKLHRTTQFLPRPETVDALQAGLSGDSYGKGSIAEQGEASALMEAIERYCGIFQGDEIRVMRRFAYFPPGEAVLPDDILLYSESQFLEGTEGAGCAGDEAPGRFDPDVETEWSPVWSLRDERFKYVPTGLLYFFHEFRQPELHQR